MMILPSNPAARGAAWRALCTMALFQGAWFACITFASREQPAWAFIAPVAAATLMLTTSDKVRADLVLVAAAVVLGLAWDTLALQAGWIDYGAPGPWPAVAPAWILALWAQLATVLRAPLHWMHSRPWLAALLGGIGGPLSYAAAQRLGACRFDDPAQALVALAIGWALITPLLVGLAGRLDAAVAESPP